MAELMKKSDFEQTEPILTPEKEVDVKALTARCIAAESKNKELEVEVNELNHQIALLRKALYGQKSEKTEILSDNQKDFELLTLFNEPEAEATESSKQVEIIVPEHKRKAKRTKEEILKDLPVEEVCDDPDISHLCPQCGTEMVVIGKDYTRDELVYIPAQMKIRRHYVETLKCPVCGTDESEDANGDDITKPVIVKGVSNPASFIPRSMCSPELLAHILYDKYVQAIPLYRQEKEFKAMGAEITRATMANWIIYAADKYIEPVIREMKKQLLTGNVIHADETVVQVLHEPGKKARTDSRMWVYCAAGNAGHANVIFEYQPTRNGDHAKAFLGNYSGYLVCDGYDGYNKLTSVTRCGCFAHLRRKFVEALPTDKALLLTAKSAKGVAYCNQIFEIERKLEDVSSEERYNQRQLQSKPVLDDFYAWLDTIHPESGTKLAKAMQYALNEKKYLYSFLLCGDIPVSNNRAENAIRPFTVGRKNWLFIDTVRGANASAMIYSIAATACANGLNVEQFFQKLFTSDTPVLPWN